MELFEKKLSEKREYVCVARDGGQNVEEQEILTEHEIDVYINGKWTKKLICSPQYLTELVYGHLYTEGLVECIDNIELVIAESGRRADVTFDEPEKVAAGERGAVHGMRSLCSISWKPEWIFAAADRFAEGMPLHEKTWATHSCFLLRKEEILFQCEDLGRHNAFDKAVGYALRNEIDLTKCMMYSSGRIPADMAKKAVRAGIPVLAAKAVPTIEAIRLAEEYGLTLIGAARQDRMKLYTGGNEIC